MKVLLAHKLFHITGGAERFFFEVGRVLEAHGHEVAYFSTKHPLNDPSPWSSYFPEAAEYQEGSLIARAFRLGKMIYSKEAKKNFARLLNAFKPDIVHAFALYIHLTPSILDACREAGVPVVMTCNDYKHICPNYKLYHHRKVCEDCRGGRFYRAATNRCCKGSVAYSVASSIEAYCHDALDIYRKNIHTFLFASEFMAHKTEEFWGGKSFRWRLLRNPFKGAGREPTGHPGDYVLYFGRLIEEKGVDLLIRAMQLIPEARLVVVGDGPQDKELRAYARSLGLNNIEFVGPLWGDAMNDMLQRARFVVVPSVWHENFPYVILQSFDMGKAVIGADRGGIPELVKHGQFGYVYPAQDHTALAEHILRLWKDPQKAVSMGTEAKRWLDEEFNDTRLYETIMNIYREVVR